jgi:hypothetical protein
VKQLTTLQQLLLFRASPSTQQGVRDLLATTQQSVAPQQALSTLSNASQQRAHQRGLFPKVSHELICSSSVAAVAVEVDIAAAVEPVLTSKVRITWLLQEVPTT